MSDWDKRMEEFLDHREASRKNNTDIAQSEENSDSPLNRIGMRINSQEVVTSAETGEKVKKGLSPTAKRGIIIGLVAATIAALILAIVPLVQNILQNRADYAIAQQLLQDEKYEEARSAFLALGPYSDAQEQAEKNVDYQEAVNTISYAENNNKAGLDAFGLTESSIEGDESIKTVLCEQAIALLMPLEDYKDSKSLIGHAQTLISEYYDQLYADQFAAAEELLSQQKYLQARDAFDKLGDYSDSDYRSLDCLYQRNEAIYEFINSGNMRGVTAIISDDTGTKTQIWLTSDALLAVGTDAIENLRSRFDAEDLEIEYQEETPAEANPICAELQRKYVELGNYQDCEEKAQSCATLGDFSREFYALCREGALQAAMDWLNKYDDPIENRDQYVVWLNQYLPWCKTWQFYSGDKTLFPRTVGSDLSCNEISLRVSLDGESATLTITAVEDSSVSLSVSAPIGDDRFILEPNPDIEQYYYYYCLINNVSHFTYSCYLENGNALGACEYQAE